MKSLVKLLGLAMLTLSFMFTTIHAGTVVTETVTYGEQLELVMNMILENYLDKDSVNADQLFEAAMSGMFDLLDPYSSYIAADDSESFTNSLNNTYVGIGVQLVQEGDYVVITRVFLNGPAYNSDIKVNDKIIAVDGESVVGQTPSEAASNILGEADTDVTLTIDRSGYIFDVTITRGTVVINAIDQLSIDEVAPELPLATRSKIGYLRIESFTNDVDDELGPILESLKEEGKTHLLLDLRDNGGGYVDSALDVLNLLVPEGPVLKFVNNTGREIVYNSYKQGQDFEIVALINDNSASATEFVASAIRERAEGILVGETTFGKGVAQYINPLADGSIVKLTQEAFYSGDGIEIHDIGVTPDVIVEIPDYLTNQHKYHLGDIYDEVLLLEQMLLVLGYQIDEVNDHYGYDTLNAIKKFQADQGLYPYGVCDFTTQKYLNTALLDSQKVNDLQLNEAIKQLVLMME